jgi:hypothetical protein
LECARNDHADTGGLLLRSLHKLLN